MNSSFSGGEEEEDVKEADGADTSAKSISCSVVAEGIVLRVDVGGLNIRLIVLSNLCFRIRRIYLNATYV